MIPSVLSDWCARYGVPEDRLSFEYADLGGTVAGDCTFYPSSVRARIRVHEALRESACEEETLWHEYCHWEEYWRYGGSSSHGERWKALYRRRSYPWWNRPLQLVLTMIYELTHRKHLISEP